ncbi:MAG: helix-turn-helix domain-containing protein [Solirubrobacterales bacterium]
MDNQKLKQWMEQNHIGNNELARKLGVSPSLISLYANGERPLSAGFKWKFLRQFGAEIASDVFNAPELRKRSIKPIPEPISQ